MYLIRSFSHFQFLRTTTRLHQFVYNIKHIDLVGYIYSIELKIEKISLISMIRRTIDTIHTSINQINAKFDKSHILWDAF